MENAHTPDNGRLGGGGVATGLLLRRRRERAFVRVRGKKLRRQACARTAANRCAAAAVAAMTHALGICRIDPHARFCGGDHEGRVPVSRALLRAARSSKRGDSRLTA